MARKPRPTTESFEHWRARTRKAFPTAEIVKWSGSRGLVSADARIEGKNIVQWRVGDPMPKRKPPLTAPNERK